MTVLKSVLRDVKSSVLRSILLADDAITRFFTTLVASGSMHYTIPTVTLTGNFDFSIDFYQTSSGTQVLIGGTDGFIAVLSNKGIQINISGLNISSATGLFVLNEFNSLRVFGDGVTLQAELNGVQIISDTYTGSSDFTVIGATFALSAFFDGILANVAFNGERLYPLDENFGETPVVKNSLAVLGPQLVTSSTTVTIPSNFSQVVIPGSGTLSTGESYLFTYRVDSTPVGGGARLRSIQGSGGLYISAGQTVSGVGTADASTITIQGNIAGEYSLTLLSVEQAPGYGTAVNISESDLFTLQNNGDYLGVELWTVGDTVSTGSEGANTTVKSAGNVLTIGDIYRSTWESVGFTAGGMQYKYGTASGISVTTNASHTEDEEAIVTTELRVRNTLSQANAGASFIKQSTKRLLESA